jgi:hypothetical protein
MMMSNMNPQRSSIRMSIRLCVSGLIAALLLLYTLGIVTGMIPDGRKLDAATLALLGLGGLSILLLLQPELLARFKTFEVGGLKLELDQLREQQSEQKIELQNLRMIVPLLFPKSERKHLLYLRDGNTKAYKGGDTLRVELRHLRACGLIRMREHRRARDIPDGTTFDLAAFVELTDFGKQWLERLKELEADDAGS